MALRVKAVERNIKFTKDENDPGVWRYVMAPELYTALNQKKVIREAPSQLSNQASQPSRSKAILN